MVGSGVWPRVWSTMGGWPRVWSAVGSGRQPHFQHNTEPQRGHFSISQRDHNHPSGLSKEAVMV